MGKGQIIAHKGNGLYDVRLTYAYRSRITARLATYTAQIAEFDAKILAETDANKKALLKLQRASIQKLYDYYSTKMPADPTVEAWCADLTEDLAYGTIVGTVEIPGEPVTVLVRPAYNGRSIYSAARDGQLMPSIAGSPHQVLFNWMILPGWQRHKPIYRTGTISAIDYDANTCTVCLEPAFSSQQNLPAVDGVGVADCGATALAGASDFCSRYPTHPFCTNSDDGAEINLTTAQLAQLQAVNQDINLNYGRQGDPSGYRTGDRWDVMAPGGSGDCEDFALTKMQALVDTYGWSPANLKLVTGYTKTGEYHAMLGVRTSNRGLMILDVNNDPVVASTKLPYRIDKIALTATSWKNYTRQLAAVPVEYMQCNSHAFAAGDRVVVQFTDQNWNTPKVVGFVENPEACTKDVSLYGTTSDLDYSIYRYSYTGDSWLNMGDLPDPWQRYGMFSSAWGAYHYLFGGVDASGAIPQVIQQTVRCVAGGASGSIRMQMPQDKAWGECFALNGKHYAVTGSNYQDGLDTSNADPVYWILRDDTYSTNYEFDDTANSWATRLNHPSGRFLGMAFAIGGYGYSFGGSTIGPFDWVGTGPATLPDNVYRYDSLGNTWESRQSMRRGKWFSAGANINGKGFAFSGYGQTAESGDITNTYGWASRWAEKYDATLDTWTLSSQAPADFYQSNGCAECGLVGIMSNGAKYVEFAQLTEAWRTLAFPMLENNVPPARYSSSMGMMMEAI